MNRLRGFWRDLACIWSYFDHWSDWRSVLSRYRCALLHRWDLERQDFHGWKGARCVRCGCEWWT